MKPTPQISSDRRENFPVTDYNYQSTLAAPTAGIKEKRGAHRRHGHWRFGAEYHRAEAAYADTADFFVFTLIGLACTWPVFSVGMAIVHVFYG